MAIIDNTTLRIDQKDGFKTQIRQDRLTYELKDHKGVKVSFFYKMTDIILSKQK